jgi:hypothetical protein
MVLWFALAGVAVSVVYAGWKSVSTDGDRLAVFLSQMLWPGAAIFAVVFIVAFAGWKLDID